MRRYYKHSSNWGWDDPEYRKSSHERPHESNLMFSVLRTALEDYFDYYDSEKRRGKRIFCEVYSWMFGENGGNWLYSFEIICNHLDIDAERLRKRILGMNENEKVEIKVLSKRMRTYRRGGAKVTPPEVADDTPEYYITETEEACNEDSQPLSEDI